MILSSKIPDLEDVILLWEKNQYGCEFRSKKWRKGLKDHR